MRLIKGYQRRSLQSKRRKRNALLMAEKDTENQPEAQERKMGVCVKNYFTLLPFLTSFFQLTLIIGSYIVGRTRNDDIDLIPYPSDLGVKFPERGLFELSLSIGSTLAFSVVLIRFIQGVNVATTPGYRRLNKAAFVFGVFMVLGEMIVAVFPDVDGLRWNHFGGACTFFFSAMIYMIMQTILSRSVFMNGKCLVIVRVLCCVFSLGSVLAYVFGRLFAPKEENRYRIPHVSEWIAGFSLNIFIFTFCSDFYNMAYISSDFALAPLDHQERF